MRFRKILFRVFGGASVLSLLLFNFTTSLYAQAPLNPLTGLPVADALALERRPMLVKVSNHGPVIRPQSGLSFADHVWEHVMEGYQLTRYTAVYYGQTPERVGSVRSTRLIDVEHLVPMYGGILVTSGGSTNRQRPNTPPRIEERLRSTDWARRVVSESYIGDAAYTKPYLNRLANIPRAGVPRYHRLFAFPAEIWKLMSAKGLNDRQPLSGLVFDTNLPPAGVPTLEVDVDFPAKGPKHIWEYDAVLGKWRSWTQEQNVRRPGPAQPDVDYLTGNQLAFDNLVVIYANHADSDFIEDEAFNLKSVGVNLLGEGRAVLLRDGLRFEGVWKRYAPDQLMQVFDVGGVALAYKPGTIWYHVIDTRPGTDVVFPK